MESFGTSPSQSTGRYFRPELSDAGTWVTPVGELYEQTQVIPVDSSSEPATPEVSDADFARLLHEGLLEYMRRAGYDMTYIIIANHQYATEVALSSEKNPDKRRAIQEASDRYLADNKEQVAKTMAIRREYTQTLIEASK